jgi:predicted permease
MSIGDKEVGVRQRRSFLLPPWGTDAMSIDDFARLLGRVTLAVAIVMIGWGLSVLLTQPVTTWFATSATISMALMLISAFCQLRGSFTAIAALALGKSPS